MSTRDELGVFWGGEEVAGVRFYGLWRGELLTPPTFPLGLWPSESEVSPWRLWGDGWTVWLWEVKIGPWPADDQWVLVVSRTLEAILRAGAGISWCAIEGCFVDPPNLFSPTAMSGGVWSCRSKGGIDVEAPELQGAFRYVSDHVLARLHAEATSLLGGDEHR